jgi:hypothetical protein
VREWTFAGRPQQRRFAAFEPAVHRRPGGRAAAADAAARPQQLHYLVVYHNMNHTNGGFAGACHRAGHFGPDPLARNGDS